ncbi:uncharacterized protein conserved in cyanobacteria [Rubidibacter lacunae KORDI 51-2]|uniref:Uncharacterized protein conserved in cyanobacteria n=1 Tax=Rubidibacter lacunae KORDI 51-2 TaxID=582515 RepID=U5DG42_9CHRO|nr:Uma2 family endonuclease [Rubidibacter lacunae]ERN40232.1 uncharacterized protein conserved in cyanobacteria [Rubidibacter lacunae KORDI 51-2]
MVALAHKKFTIEQYQRMAEVGILTECDRVELIEGAIVEMSPLGSKHIGCVNRLAELFFMALSDVALVQVQSSVRVSDRSQPQPDLAILQRRSDFYSGKLPEPEDIFALVEVADTTINYDRTVKAPLYARADIREVWIVDLNTPAIEIYRNPSPDGYTSVQTVRPGESLAFQAFPDRPFAVGEILADAP